MRTWRLHSPSEKYSFSMKVFSLKFIKKDLSSRNSPSFSEYNQKYFVVVKIVEKARSRRRPWLKRSTSKKNFLTKKVSEKSYYCVRLFLEANFQRIYLFRRNPFWERILWWKRFSEMVLGNFLGDLENSSSSKVSLQTSPFPHTSEKFQEVIHNWKSTVTVLQEDFLSKYVVSHNPFQGEIFAERERVLF